MAGAIPDDLRAAIDRSPEDERALLELRLTRPHLDDAQARIAARLQVFLVTWDPLDWHDRPPGRATATGDGDGFEVVLYVPLDDVLSAAHASGEEIAVVLGDLGGSVLNVGARYEQALVAGAHPQLAFAGSAPGLLSEVGTLSGLDPPALGLVSTGWEPIGLGAITDLAWRMPPRPSGWQSPHPPPDHRAATSARPPPRAPAAAPQSGDWTSPGRALGSPWARSRLTGIGARCR